MYFDIFLLKIYIPFIDWSDKNLLKVTEFLALTQIFSYLHLCKLVMVLTFDSLKLKLFDLIDFTGWTIKGYMTSGCKNIRVCDNWTQLLFGLLFYTLYKMRLYLAVFDFQHKKWMIFNLFLNRLKAMVFFQTQPKSDVFP